MAVESSERTGLGSSSVAVFRQRWPLTAAGLDLGLFPETRVID